MSISKLLFAAKDRQSVEPMLALLQELPLQKCASITVLHATAPYEAAVKWPNDEYKKETAQLVQYCSDKIKLRFPEATVKQLAIEESIIPSIVEVVKNEKFDSLILGSHSGNGFAKMFHENVAELIMLQAECSVFIARKISSTLASPDLQDKIVMHV